jgi:hypothetical protein
MGGVLGTVQLEKRRVNRRCREAGSELKVLCEDEALFDKTLVVHGVEMT